MKQYLDYWKTVTDGTHVVLITRENGIAVEIKVVGWLWV